VRAGQHRGAAARGSGRGRAPARSRRARTEPTGRPRSRHRRGRPTEAPQTQVGGRRAAGGGSTAHDRPEARHGRRRRAGQGRGGVPGREAAPEHGGGTRRASLRITAIPPSAHTRARERPSPTRAGERGARQQPDARPRRPGRHSRPVDVRATGPTRHHPGTARPARAVAAPPAGPPTQAPPRAGAGGPAPKRGHQHPGTRGQTAGNHGRQAPAQREERPATESRRTGEHPSPTRKQATPPTGRTSGRAKRTAREHTERASHKQPLRPNVRPQPRRARKTNSGRRPGAHPRLAKRRSLTAHQARTSPGPARDSPPRGPQGTRTDQPASEPGQERRSAAAHRSAKGTQVTPATHGIGRTSNGKPGAGAGPGPARERGATPRPAGHTHAPPSQARTTGRHRRPRSRQRTPAGARAGEREASRRDAETPGPKHR